MWRVVGVLSFIQNSRACLSCLVIDLKESLGRMPLLAGYRLAPVQKPAQPHGGKCRGCRGVRLIRFWTQPYHNGLACVPFLPSLQACWLVADRGFDANDFTVRAWLRFSTGRRLNGWI